MAEQSWLTEQFEANRPRLRGVAYRMLGSLSELALWGSLASILAGAAVYGIAQNTGNYAGGYLGKRLALAGAIGACLAGIAPTAINLLFSAAK